MININVALPKSKSKVHFVPPKNALSNFSYSQDVR